MDCRPSSCRIASTRLSSVSFTFPCRSSSSPLRQSSSEENSFRADCALSSASVSFTFSSLTANSLIALKDGSLEASVSSGALTSSSPNLWIRTMSKAFINFPQAGSVAWWEYANFPS